jgi:pilus assembly protein CpaF
VKLSERFDRRYQQSPTATMPAPPAIVPPPEDLAPPEPAPTTPPTVAPEEVLVQPQPLEPGLSLSPALAAAKAEIHAQLLSHHTAQIDINNRAGIRRLLLQLTEEHFRNKPPAAIVTATDKDRLVEILFDEVIGLGPLESLLRDPDVSEVMVNRPEQIFVERKGKIELTSLAFEDERSLRRVIDRIVSTIGRRVDESEPMCDARLKDGSRVNVVKIGRQTRTQPEQASREAQTVFHPLWIWVSRARSAGQQNVDRPILL